MTQFVRTTGGLLQLKSGAVNTKDVAKVLEFATRLGFVNESKARAQASPDALRSTEERKKAAAALDEQKRREAVLRARIRAAIRRKNAVQSDELQDLQAKVPEAFR